MSIKAIKRTRNSRLATYYSQRYLAAYGGVMCKGITEADKEIIDILKELFRNKNNEFVDPDDLLLEQIVKWSIYLALLGLLILLPIKIFGNADQSAASSMLSGIVGVAFTLLFIYLNIKSKNPSIIMYVLTWFSLMLSLWVAG